MEKLIQIIKKVFLLPNWLTLLIAIPSFGLVIYTLTLGEQNWLAFLSYGLSAYALGITGTWIFRVVMFFRKRDIKGELGEHIHNETAHRLMEDSTYRAKMGLYVGIGINFAYIAIKLFYGIKYQSFWFIGLAAYYLILTWLRGALLQFLRQHETVGTDKLLELRKMRRCGTLLLWLHGALAVIVFFMVFYNQGMEYPGLLIYAMAAYTFYSFGMAFYNLLKYRKSESPVMMTLKILGFTTALVSMLSLETAMINSFGADSGEDFRYIMVSLTGAGVCIIVLALAIYMIYYVKRETKKIFIKN